MIKKELDLREWQRLSEDWEESGLNQKEYCKRQEVSWNAFSQARTKLMMQGLAKPCYNNGKSRANQEALRFIPVSLAATEESARQKEVSVVKSSFIEINLPHGIVMRIPT